MRKSANERGEKGDERAQQQRSDNTNEITGSFLFMKNIIRLLSVLITTPRPDVSSVDVGIVGAGGLRDSIRRSTDSHNRQGFHRQDTVEGFVSSTEY